jgi:hypothetical protein
MPTRAEQAADWGPYLRDLRARAVSKGRCYECRKRPARPGRRRCEVCAERHGKLRRDTQEKGTCYELCGRPRASGRIRCPDCLVRAAARAQARRDERRAANASPTSAVPSNPLRTPGATDGPRKGDSAHPAEVGTSPLEEVA